jgi:hypothetical protein
MNKYIPKVGEKFEWRSDSCGIWQKAGACIAHSTKAVGYENPNGWITSVDKEFQFRPIPTKSDVEREQLLDIMNKIFYGKNSHKIVAVQEIQQAGFTIPKKVKRSDIDEALNIYVRESELDESINDICNLLGDLVEDNTNEL